MHSYGTPSHARRRRRRGEADASSIEPRTMRGMIPPRARLATRLPERTGRVPEWARSTWIRTVRMGGVLHARADSKPKVPAAIERFLKQLVVTNKAVGLYPTSSSIPRENASETVAILRGIFQTRPDMRLQVTKECLQFESVPVFAGQAVFTSFARELYNRHLAEIRFHTGITENDILAFLGLLKMDPQHLAKAGGFEVQLWELQVDTITVLEVRTKVVDADIPENAEGEMPAQVAGEPWPPKADRIEEIIAGAFGGRPRDQRLLVRIAESPKLISAYFKETLSGRGARPAVAWLSRQLSSLAHAVYQELPGEQPIFFRSLAEALGSLEPALRARVLCEKVLPDARHDEALAMIVRQMSIEEVCQALAQGLADGHVSEEGIARAIRNLALVNLSSREEVVVAAASAMQAAGVDEETAAKVTQSAAPSRIEVSERAAEQGRQPLDEVLRLADLAVVSKREPENDPKRAELAAAIRRGFTDGDVTAALVALITLDNRSTPFANIMSIIEDSAPYMLKRGDYEEAAELADALIAAASDETLTAPQKKRVSEVLASLAKPDEMRQVSTAMRVFPVGSVEHEACRRLLRRLGSHAVEPLLEILADEPDMTARKAIIDLVTGIATEFVGDLGARVSDPRWYVVRNVVGILGSTKDPAALPYLSRTIRHGDARVRRETIRAAATIRDRLAGEMLIAALADDDAQNVQLAARYLGASGDRSAVPALAQLANGEGAGNRDLAPRIEAIEAMGRIGSPDALPTLEALVSKRTLLRSSETRELRAAAQAALGTIRVRRSGGEVPGSE